MNAGLFGNTTRDEGGRSPDRERAFESSSESNVRSQRGEIRGRGSQRGEISGRASQGGAEVEGRGQSGGRSSWIAGAEHPIAMMRRMQDDLDRVFRVFGIPRVEAVLGPARELEELLARSPGLTRTAQWSPQIEVFERDGNLVVHADLPGVRREDVEVNVENEVLTIRGERRQQQEGSEGGYRRTERSYGSFFRQIPLPEGADPDQIEASYDNGVLEVVVPAPSEQPRGRKRIDIR